MPAPGPSRHPLRDRIIAALRSGEITVPEAVWLAAVTRQRINQWCIAEGVDPQACRSAYLKKLWAKEKRRQRMKARGKTPKGRSKPEKRADAAAPIARFIEGGGTIKRL